MSVRVPDERLDVLTRLRNGIEANGCLCLSSRCPIHGESSGLLATAYLALVREGRAALVADLRAARADNQRLRQARDFAALAEEPRA